MKDPLREIFEHFQDVHSPTAEYWALCRAEEDVLNQARSVMGAAFVDELLRRSADVNWQSEYEWFREGFRLGAALILEAGSFPA
ncbi:MAG: hypothetical protein HFF76_06015 [Oscillospiraceae bacterium]|jgi:hypothetical protein|nr:hypothetical protein [Oscillospiraceae bacterium]